MEQDQIIYSTIELNIEKKFLIMLVSLLTDNKSPQSIFKFYEEIKNKVINATNLDSLVTVETTIGELFEVVEILGKLKEFYYADYNKILKDKVVAKATQLSQSSNELEIAQGNYIFYVLSNKLNTIESNLNYLLTKGIDILKLTT